MGSAVFEMLIISKYESGVVGARRRLLFTLKMQLFCTLASPSTPVYGMKSWIDPTLPVASRSVQQYGCIPVPGVHIGRRQTVPSLPVDPYVASRAPRRR